MATGFDYLCPVEPTLRPVDDRRDHCDHCQKDVYHLSSMTRAEAVATLADARMPCVRFTVRQGEVRFRGEPEADRAGPTLGRIARLSALAGALAGCAAQAPETRPALAEGSIVQSRSTQRLCGAVDRLDALVWEAERAAEAIAASRPGGQGARAGSDEARAAGVARELAAQRDQAATACERARARDAEDPRLLAARARALEAHAREMEARARAMDAPHPGDIMVMGAPRRGVE